MSNRKPYHVSKIYFPGGKVIVFERHPTGKLKKIKGHCKFCNKTHSNWWQMRHEDYDADVVLCGECEYTSARENI